MQIICNLIRVLMFISCFILIGCVIRDVTRDQEYIGGYEKGKIFIAQKDLVIDESGVLVDDNLTVVGLKSGRIPPWFKGIMKKGERLQIERILFKRHPEIGDSIHPIGLILDGKWKGEFVDLYLVSKILDHVITRRSRFVVLTNDPKRFVEMPQSE